VASVNGIHKDKPAATVSYERNMPDIEALMQVGKEWGRSGFLDDATHYLISCTQQTPEQQSPEQQSPEVRALMQQAPEQQSPEQRYPATLSRNSHLSNNHLRAVGHWCKTEDVLSVVSKACQMQHSVLQRLWKEWCQKPTTSGALHKHLMQIICSCFGPRAGVCCTLLNWFETDQLPAQRALKVQLTIHISTRIVTSF